MQSFSTKDPRLTLAFLLERRESQFFEIKGCNIKPSKLANETISDKIRDRNAIYRFADQ